MGKELCDADKEAKLKQTQARVHPRHPQVVGNALLFIPPEPFRTKLHMVVTHPWFDNLIMLCILESTFVLILDDASMDPDSDLGWFIAANTSLLNWIFLGECVSKVLTYGFIYKHEDTYLRD